MVTIKDIANLSVEEAAIKTGKSIIPTRIDGQDMGTDCSMRPERIRVEVRDGKIVKILGRG